MRHFTIILPTRNRADTLQRTVESCLAQDYERMTLLVSDNCSSDNTQEVLSAFNDKRLRVIRTPQGTSMTANVDFALDHVLDQDTHVTCFGDDDGLIPGALADADRLLNQFPTAEILTWSTSNYFWPNCPVKEWQNNLQLSVSDHVELFNSNEMLAKLANYSVYYHHLPGLWTSLVPASLLRRCKERNGRICISFTPDVGSSVMLACMTKSYVFSHRSVSMLGSSSHSTGLSFSQEMAKIKECFLAESTIPPHEDLEVCSHGVYYIAESLLRARDLNLLPKNFHFDWHRTLRLMMVRRATDSDATYNETCKAVEKTATRNGIPYEPEEWIRENEATGAAAALFCDPIVMKHARSLTHRCDPRLVSNIAEATRLSGELLRARQAREILSIAEHEEIVNAGLAQVAELKTRITSDKSKVANLKELNSKLRQKLDAIQERRDSGLLPRLRQKLRRLRGKE